jgi:hypothetical protein
MPKMNNPFISCVSFLLPGLLDYHFISNSKINSIIIGGITWTLLDGLRKCLNKKITESIKQTIIGKASSMNIVAKNEMLETKLECILPTLQIFISSNLLGLYFLVNLKKSISILLFLSILLFQKRIYDKFCNKDIVRIYMHLFFEVKQYFMQFFF